MRAVVLNGPGMGNIRCVQDGEAGLALYGQPAKLPGYGELQAGDSVEVTGRLKFRNGLPELNPTTSLHKLAAGQRLHALQVPTAQATAACAETDESRSVEITGVSRLLTPAGNASYLLNGTAGNRGLQRLIPLGCSIFVVRLFAA